MILYWILIFSVVTMLGISAKVWDYFQRKKINEDLDNSYCHICDAEANWKCTECNKWICNEHTHGMFKERVCEECTKKWTK